MIYWSKWSYQVWEIYMHTGLAFGNPLGVPGKPSKYGQFLIRPAMESSPKLKLRPWCNPAPKVDVAAPQRALRPDYDRRYPSEQASLTKVEQVSSYLGEAKLGREGDGGGFKGAANSQPPCVHPRLPAFSATLESPPRGIISIQVRVPYKCVLYCNGRGLVW